MKSQQQISALLGGAVALLFLLLLSTSVDMANAYGAPACNCGIGNIEEEAPRCLCACSGDYLQPRCLYTETDRVRMEFWLDQESDYFSSKQFKNRLETALLEPSDSIDFNWAVSTHNKTNAYFTMSGKAAHQLLIDWESNHWYLRKLYVESVFEDVKRPAPLSPLQEIAVWYSDDTMEINSETTAWIMGAVGLLLFAIMVECCCMKNTEEIIFEKELAAGPIQGGPTRRRDFTPSERPVDPSGHHHHEKENHKTKKKKKSNRRVDDVSENEDSFASAYPASKA